MPIKILRLGFFVKIEFVNVIYDLVVTGLKAFLKNIRIKNAQYDPTYLIADVQIVSAYEVYNVNPHKLEQLIHQLHYLYTPLYP